MDFVERDVFCQACNERIDHQVWHTDCRDEAVAEAMLSNEAIHHHRKATGCAADQGWRNGPWSDEKRETVH